MTALYAAAKGWQSTAPVMATRLFERYLFVKHHSGWTYADYDAAEAGDILLDKEYRSMMSGLLNAKQSKC